MGPVENHAMLLSLTLFYPSEISCNDPLNGFMVTHNIHFTLLALGLKKQRWLLETHLEENKEIMGHLAQCMMECVLRNG